MTTAVDQFNSAGIDRVYWAVNSAVGYPYGTSGTIAAAGDASMGRLVGTQSANVPMQEPRKVAIGGDDGNQANYYFEPEEAPNGDLVLANIDLTLWAKSQGIKVYADGDFDVVIGQPDSPTYNSLTLMTIAQAKSAQSGSVGNAGWMVKIYPRVQIVPIGDGGQNTAAGANFTHKLTANKFDTLPWGIPLSSADNGTLKGAVYGPFYSENRVCLHTHVGDGSDLAVTLAYAPVAANGNKVKLWQNGVAKAYTTDYTVSGSVVTFASAPANGVVSVIRYEHT